MAHTQQVNALLRQARRNALEQLRPPARLPLSQWIERHIVLPSDMAALPGKVKLWPYQRQIADSIGDPSVERVSVIKPARVGYTTLLTSIIGHFAANEPCPVLVLLPTESDCRDYMVSEVEPMFAASPVLHGLLSADTDEDSRNTLLSRRFAGGSLKIVASRAPRNLRRHTARVLLADEVDGMDVTIEGAPLKLAEKRTLSFNNRKIVIGSTPVFMETSQVLRAYESSDQRIYEVPCPSCGGFAELEWESIEWPPGRPEEAAWRCPHCEALVDERHKLAMVESGAWRAMRPDVAGHHGYRLSALVSLLANASWGKLAAEFLSVKDDPTTLQVFINTALGRGWREAGAELDENSLAARAEPFGLDSIPLEVLVITCGVDVQDDRLEVTIAGWTRESVCLILGHVIIWGSADDDLTWLELDSLLKTTWPHPLGGRIGVDGAVIDSGDGDWTDKVYSFCFPRASRRIMAGKGMYGARPSIQVSKSKVKGGRLWLVGVDTLKSTIFDRLARGKSIRFSKSLEPVYFEQLASERRVVRYKRGAPTRRFERISGRPAEALDCLCYATAARAAVTISLDTRFDQLHVVKAPAARPTVIRSKWMSR